MTTHFIVSVGTSIIGKYEKANKSAKVKPSLIPGEPIPEPKQLLRSFDERKFRDPNCMGAEENTIRKVIENGLGAEENPTIKNSRFHLIATYTAECRFCASYLGHIFLEKAKKVEYYAPLHLGEAKDASFAQKGVPALLSTVAQILDQVEKQGHKAVIIPTGGYKAIIPYMTIAAILYKIPIYYIYEESEELLELPAPPLGVEGAGFRSALVLLENIQGADKDSAAPYLEELSESFRNLVHETEDGHYAYTAFGEKLKKQFTAVPASPLTVRVVGNTLIPRLGEIETDFREMTKLGETIWIGDKAPVMADHARHHHVNLLAYAELILSPLLRDNPEFLSKEELFLLLGMIYLHDCGHSLCMIPDNKTGEEVPLLPTEIRDFHNLLGYHRMTDEKFMQSLGRQGFPEDQLDALGKTLQNIATLSLYHRKKMSLLHGDYKGPDGKPFQALADCRIEQGEKRARGELLVALFRIIDGMDKQIGRAGDAVEISMRAESILADLGHLHSRIQRLEKMISTMSSETKEAADAILKDIFDDYREKEKPSADEDGARPIGVERACLGCGKGNCAFELKSPPANMVEGAKYAKLREDLNQHQLDQYLPLAWEYLEARVRFMFQALQPSYYYSDLLLTMPRVSHSKDNGGRRIVINYDAIQDEAAKNKVAAVWEEIRKWISDNVKDDEPEKDVLKAGLPTAEKVVEGVRDEYCNKKFSEVAHVLHDHKVTIEFQFNGKTVPCWRTEAA